MIKNNKLKVIISSVIILLPIIVGLVLWNRLPESMTTHWGADGAADGLGSKAFAVFVLPLILLALHWICLIFTSLDKNQKGQNQKALGIVFWIIPFISLMANGVVYSTAFGRDFKFEMFFPILFGVMFVFIGNYLPKIKQNKTLGIKIPWTLENEENWNRTHRFGGKIWVVGGLALMLFVFLPEKLMFISSMCVTMLLVIVPMIYSYCIYKQHRKEGIVYVPLTKGKSEKAAYRFTAVFVPVLLAAVVVLMFTGNIDINCGETSIKIDATYWNELEVDYSQIDSIEYRDNVDPGIRTNGFGSARLSLGNFRNDEFGAYTRYAYTGEKDVIVIKSGNKTLVFNEKSADDTKAIYETISAKL